MSNETHRPDRFDDRSDSCISADLPRAPGPRYQDLLDAETRPVPDILRIERPADLGTGPIKASRYTSAEFFDEEVRKVWYRTWQFACREEHIPAPGDSHVFDLVDRSVILTRQADGTIRAFLNVCPHRGRQIVTTNGRREFFRCAYHGLAWNIDGSHRSNPFAWDFAHVPEKKMCLNSVRCESWGGFVFVNFDSDAPPLVDMLKPLPEHFAHWKFDECYVSAHVGKIAPANWKACSEAFLEAFHVIATHPQAAPFIPAEGAQYDLMTDHVARFLSPTATASTIAGTDLDDAARIKMMSSVGSRAGKGDFRSIGEGVSAREYMGSAARAGIAERTGRDTSDIPNAEVIDGISYDFFPNFHLWGGFAQKICYRFRPVGRNHEQTLMEVMLFQLAPEGEKPEPAPYRLLGPDEPWAEATELNYLSGIYDQDQANLGPLQAGLRTLGDGDLQFARYGDMRGRNLHRMIDRYIAS